ncbi:MAG: N-acetylmuramoyl-L-alanine amidase [Lachnospiraceae bacterium]|nr:N-acetylmuramoyl-L-alanine amidase [Bacteroides sp.]MCM1223130.1 N-acetylmuramoyl-L-alanine amidase [Lachnospiraceae bacterium]
MIELYDNGHGIDTAGKCSPDMRLREYKKARELVNDIVLTRRIMGYDARILVPEDKDVSLQERVRRVNEICKQYGTENVIVVSIHCNAAGADGKWKTAGGWCVYTSPGQTKADKLATCLYESAQVALKDYIDKFQANKQRGAYDSKQKPMRTDYSDKDPDYEANFYILTKTKCPAVLTENLFQDNKADVDFLISKEGHEAIVKLHVDGVDKYIKSL